MALILSALPVSGRAGELLGGHDGGGANLWNSTPEQVNAAIDWALATLKKDGPNWLFMAGQYGPKIDVNGMTDVSVIQCLAMPLVCHDGDEVGREIDQGKVEMKAWDYLSQSVIERKLDGPCPAPDKDHAAGSVSEFKVGAHVCLSVYELSRTVPSGMRAQVASVLAHEMAHLQGFGEEIAVGVQKAVVENFPQITREDGSFLAYRLTSQMMLADSALINARGMSKEGAMGPGYYLVGYAAGILNTVGEMLPDGINDNTIPVIDPSLYKGVMKALRDLENECTGLSWKSATISKAEFDEQVKQLEAGLLTVSKQVETFLGQKVQRF